jgi:hypothetical protein
MGKYFVEIDDRILKLIAEEEETTVDVELVKTLITEELEEQVGTSMLCEYPIKVTEVKQ